MIHPPTDAEASLSADNQQRLRRLRRTAGLMDSAFSIPGTGIRFGWDSIIGLIPGAGDTLTAVVAVQTLHTARKLRVPKRILARMLGNIGLDLAVGVFPVVGDLLDVYFKANVRNVQLIERHLAKYPKLPSRTST